VEESRAERLSRWVTVGRRPLALSSSWYPSKPIPCLRLHPADRTPPARPWRPKQRRPSCRLTVFDQASPSSFGSWFHWGYPPEYSPLQYIGQLGAGTVILDEHPVVELKTHSRMTLCKNNVSGHSYKWGERSIFLLGDRSIFSAVPFRLSSAL